MYKSIIKLDTGIHGAIYYPQPVYSILQYIANRTDKWGIRSLRNLMSSWNSASSFVDLSGGIEERDLWGLHKLRSKIMNLCAN